MATRSKMSLTKEFRMDMARLEIPVSGCTCFSTKINASALKMVLKLRLDDKWLLMRDMG